MTRLLTLALAAAVASTAAAAQDARSPIAISQPWLRATPNGAPVAGGYVTITNSGSTPDRLIGASLATAANGEVHSMTMAGGVMHMARLPDGLAIPPGQTMVLAPGGNHLMFMKPTVQLKVGENVKGTLTFAKAGTMPVTFRVAGMAAKTAPGAAAQAGMSGMKMPGMSGKP